MLFSYNADLLPQVRMMGQIRYSEPWLHFSRCINEWVLYVIRDGNLYLQEDGVRYHLAAGDFFLLEPGLTHEGYQRSACDYYYVHFSHPDMGRMGDETAAMAALADKRRKSLTSYNLDPGDPTDPITYLPKQFHLTGRSVEPVYPVCGGIHRRHKVAAIADPVYGTGKTAEGGFKDGLRGAPVGQDQCIALGPCPNIIGLMPGGLKHQRFDGFRRSVVFFRRRCGAR